jgi:hypothetical protein
MDKNVKRLLEDLEKEVSNAVPFRHYQAVAKSLFASAQLIEALKAHVLKKHHRLHKEAGIFLNTINEMFADGSIVMYTELDAQEQWISNYMRVKATIDDMPKPKRKK